VDASGKMCEPHTARRTHFVRLARMRHSKSRCHYARAALSPQLLAGCSNCSGCSHQPHGTSPRKIRVGLDHRCRPGVQGVGLSVAVNNLRRFNQFSFKQTSNIR
jgi:hypothetical protein